jgi:fumarate reductase subunit D
MQPVRYLFYRLYLWQVSCWKDDKVSINALVLLVVLLCINLITLLGLAESITGTSFLLTRFSQKIAHIGILMIGALIALPLYYSLVHKARYRHIVKEFEVESARQRQIRGLGVLLYVVFPFVLLFAVALLHGQRI